MWIMFIQAMVREYMTYTQVKDYYYQRLSVFEWLWCPRVCEGNGIDIPLQLTSGEVLCNVICYL